MQCINRDDPDSKCTGEVREYLSRSGCTVAERCDAHQGRHNQHMDQVEAGLTERYPGWNVPGSPPPLGFDPAYAGERWDENY